MDSVEVLNCRLDHDLKVQWRNFELQKEWYEHFHEREYTFTEWILELSTEFELFHIVNGLVELFLAKKSIGKDDPNNEPPATNREVSK